MMYTIHSMMDSTSEYVPYFSVSNAIRTGVCASVYNKPHITTIPHACVERSSERFQRAERKAPAIVAPGLSFISASYVVVA